MKRYEEMFRPAHELAACFGWIFSCLALLVLQPPFWYWFELVAISLALVRFAQVKRLWKFRLSLSVMRARVIDIYDLIRVSRKMRKDRKSLYLGRGFKWGQRHAEIASDIMNRNVDELPDVPDWVNRAMEYSKSNPKFGSEPTQTFWEKVRGGAVQKKIISAAIGGIFPKDSTPITDDSIGSPWIHGIGAEEDEDIPLPLGSLTGHTLITGTTRAGKTRLYEMLTTQIIDMGSTLIVIDPKKDNDWVMRLRSECRRAGRTFLYFDAARPSESIRINPLANFNNLSEVATRIGQLVDADGSFAAFAWKTLFRVQRGLVAAGIRPNIKNTKYYVEMGVDKLAEQVIEQYLMNLSGPDWDRDIKNQPAAPSGGKNQPLSRLEQMIVLYDRCGSSNDAINGLVAMVRHSKEHFSKMIQVLEPILEMLGSDEVGELLAPDPASDDPRPIWDIKKIIDEKAVLYVGLDSLSNKIVSGAIGSILLADISSTLGNIYNFKDPADAYLFVDEAAEVANDQLIQILNKGGGAGMKVMLAAQSIADFTVRFSSKDKAEQTLANLNNLISLRVRSFETAKYVSDMFSEVQVRSIEKSYSSGSESSASFTEFRSNVSTSLSTEKSALVSPSLLMRLPPLHFFAFISGRNYWKGSLEFITGDKTGARK